jgi:hypothetical protein
MKHLGCTTARAYFIFCPGKICTLHYTPLGILRIAQATYDHYFFYTLLGHFLPQFFTI